MGNNTEQYMHPGSNGGQYTHKGGPGDGTWLNSYTKTAIRLVFNK